MSLRTESGSCGIGEKKRRYRVSALRFSYSWRIGRAPGRRMSGLGAKGARGATGAIGARGSKGATGAIGARGAMSGIRTKSIGRRFGSEPTHPAAHPLHQTRFRASCRRSKTAAADRCRRCPAPWLMPRGQTSARGPLRASRIVGASQVPASPWRSIGACAWRSDAPCMERQGAAARPGR